MSLMRLLTAGKSLVGVKDNASRYRMGHPGMLPKFGSAKDAGVGDQKAIVRNASQPVATVETGAGPFPPSAASAEANKPKAPVATAASQPNHAPETAVTSRGIDGSFFSRWLVQLRAVVARPSANGSTSLRLSRTPVQGELSLDNIKVVRNDLSDADLEVVPLKAKSNPTPEPGDSHFGAAPKAGAAERAEPERSNGLSGRPNVFSRNQREMAMEKP